MSQLKFKHFALILILVVPLADAADLLPYGTRTRAYNGYTATIRGDNENVGMAGATVAVPYSVSTLEANPAGLTMTMGDVTAQINSNAMEDRTISSKKTHYNQWGLSVTPDTWGYAISHYVPSREQGDYISPNNNGETDYEMSLRSLRFSVAHLMLDKKLSLGVSFDLNQAVRRLSSEEHTDTKLTYKLGAIYHVKNHYLVGVSFSPGLEIGGNASSLHPDMPGFDQPIRTPPILNMGVAWVPNRFFRLGSALVIVGKTRDTALLRDQSITIGDKRTYQPRLGASYVVGQFNHLKIVASGGMYWEHSRIQNQPSRLHGTAALDVNPYFINLGVGVDRATHYNNFFMSIGIDIVRTLRSFDIIPKETVPPLKGYWPNPFLVSADGLPNAMTHGENKGYKGESVEDVQNIILDIPKNIGNKIDGKPAVHETPKRRPPEPKSKGVKSPKQRKKTPKSNSTHQT